MVLIGNSNDGQRLAESLDVDYISVQQTNYPDSEVDLSFSQDFSDQNVILFFQFDPLISLDAQFLNLLAVLDGLRNFSVRLILPYIPYLRSVHTGTRGRLNKLHYLLSSVGSSIQELITVQPHCSKKEIEVLASGVKVTVADIDSVLKDFLKRQFSDYRLVSPDSGFGASLKRISDGESIVLEKERLSPTDVSINGHQGLVDSNFKGTYVLTDDIVSTGNTLWSATQYLKGQGINKISCVVIHNLIRDNVTVEKFREADIELFFSNTLAREGASLDVIGAIANTIKTS